MNCRREAYACGKAKGVNFSFDDVDAYITDFGSKMLDARPSMLLDHLNKKRCEMLSKRKRMKPRPSNAVWMWRRIKVKDRPRNDKRRRTHGFSRKPKRGR